MGRKSTLRRLPPEIQTEINRILSEGRLTLDELLEHLRGLGVEGISRSALGRQKQKIDKVAAKLRQSREIVDALVEKTGPSKCRRRRAWNRTLKRRYMTGFRRKPSGPWRLRHARPGFRLKRWKPSRAASLG